MKRYSKTIIFLIFILFILGVVFYVVYKKNSFSNLYSNVPKDNVYKKINIDDALDLIENKTGIIYIGYPTCPWCKSLVPILNEVAKEDEVNTVYYIDDFYSMRPDKNEKPKNVKEYNKLVDLLGSEIVDMKSENSQFNVIKVPLVLFIKDGKIVDYHKGTYQGHTLKEKVDKDGNTIKYLEELTEKQKNQIKNTLDKKIRKVYSNKCDDTGC